MTPASELLATHPFLSDMDEQYLTRLSYWSRRTVFHAGSRIFSEGRTADRFWLIRNGSIRLDATAEGSADSDDGDIVVETIGSGTVLGWSWLFPPYRWHFSATALEPVLAIEFDAAGVRRLCDSDPALGYDLTRRFMAVVVERMQSTRMRLLDQHRSRQ